MRERDHCAIFNNPRVFFSVINRPLVMRTCNVLRRQLLLLATRKSDAENFITKLNSGINLVIKTISLNHILFFYSSHSWTAFGYYYCWTFLFWEICLTNATKKYLCVTCSKRFAHCLCPRDKDNYNIRPLSSCWWCRPCLQNNLLLLSQGGSLISLELNLVETHTRRAGRRKV